MVTWFARHPVAANLLMTAIMLLGIVSLPQLQRATFPRIQSDKVQIRVVYPGATADDVEDAICRRIEDALEGISDLEEARCEAREGVGTATAVMVEGAAMMQFLGDVKSAVDAIADFPEHSETPLVDELGRTDAVVSVAITGPDDPVVLKAYALDVKARLQALPTVAQVNLNGFSDHQIRIEVPASRLRLFGLSATDIATAVQRHSVSAPSGRLQDQHEDVLLRVDDRRKTVADFRRLPILAGPSGATIELGQVASITDRFELDHTKILFNGKRAAILEVTKTRQQDILTALESVTALVARENANAPRGVQLTLTQDRASVVADRLGMLVRNGAQGLVLVFLVLWLFFSVRYSFWVTMGLPVSFLGALCVLPMMGVTINMISMVGLLIGIGLLMDDAIVIAENVATRLHRGEPAMDAAVHGVTQVLPGIASSFATTLLVFGSLAFIGGEMGQVLRVLPIVLIVVLTVSLVEAFLILPSHLGHASNHLRERRPAPLRERFEAGFEQFRDRRFGWLVDRAIEYRYLTLGVVLMLMLSAVAMPLGGKLKFVGFPTIEGDVIEARVLLPQGTPLARTEAVVGEITDALAQTNQAFSAREPGHQSLVRNITVVFGENPDAYESGPHVARVIADLLGTEQRSAALDDFRDAWRDAVGSPTDVLGIKFTEPVIGPGGRAIDVRLIGDDLSQLKAASLELQRWLAGYAGVTDLGDDMRPGKREYRLHLKPDAGVLGVDASTLADQVRTAFQGRIVDEFPVGAETYEVDLRLTAAGRLNADDLEQLSITGPDGALIPLAVVADIEEARGWARINRVDGQRTVTVQGDVQTGVANAQELLTLAQSTIFPRLRERYPGTRVDIQGASNESAQTGKSIVRGVLLGLIGVYMLLALQFRGYLAPLAVMCVIPTALVGVVFGHLALGLDMTMPGMVGMASLFGVVVNDSILLVVFMRDARARGVPVPAAARQASRARFRPIVLTSVTTIAGLAPLLAETSMQAQILIPLAASLAFGLTSATLIALFLVPALYCILDDFDLLGEVQDAGAAPIGHHDQAPA